MESNPKSIFLQDQNLLPQLYLMLSTAIEMLKADKGNIHLYNPKSHVLQIAAHIGFNDESLNRFKTVMPGDAACGTALKTKQRVIIENVFLDPRFSHLAPAFHRYGFYAVQSTPLLDARGRVFGVLSTHFEMPHAPTDQELEQLDLYLNRAVPVIARRIQPKLTFAASFPALQAFFQRKSRPSDYPEMSGQNN
jgi:GAF domain-containing protein